MRVFVLLGVVAVMMMKLMVLTMVVVMKKKKIMMITMNLMTMMVMPYLLLCEGAEPPLGVGGPLMAEHHHTPTRLAAPTPLGRMLLVAVLVMSSSFFCTCKLRQRQPEIRVMLYDPGSVSLLQYKTNMISIQLARSLCTHRVLLGCVLYQPRNHIEQQEEETRRDRALFEVPAVMHLYGFNSFGNVVSPMVQAIKCGREAATFTGWCEHLNPSVGAGPLGAVCMPHSLRELKEMDRVPVNLVIGYHYYRPYDRGGCGAGWGDQSHCGSDIGQSCEDDVMNNLHGRRPPELKCGIPSCNTASPRGNVTLLPEKGCDHHGPHSLSCPPTTVPLTPAAALSSLYHPVSPSTRCAAALLLSCPDGASASTM